MKKEKGGSHIKYFLRSDASLMTSVSILFMSSVLFLNFVNIYLSSYISSLTDGICEICELPL